MRWTRKRTESEHGVGAGATRAAQPGPGDPLAKGQSVEPDDPRPADRPEADAVMPAAQQLAHGPRPAAGQPAAPGGPKPGPRARVRIRSRTQEASGEHQTGAPEPLSWRLQCGFGIAVAVFMCSALTLTDDHVDAYLFALGFTLPATLVGLGLRGRFSRKKRASIAAGGVLLGLVSGLLLSLAPGTGIGWLLGLVSGLALGALLCTPMFLSQRDGRLLVPIAASIAATAALTSLTFYARPPPFKGNMPTAWVALPQGEPASPGLFLVVYSFHGCGHPVTVNFMYTRGAVPPSAEAVISDYPVQLPPQRGLGPLPRQLSVYALSPDPYSGGSAGPSTPVAVQPRPRGFIGSCYIALPQFDGPWTGLGDRYGSFTGVSAETLNEGSNALFLNGGALTVISGESPTRAGDPSTWACHASAEKSTPTFCGAILMLTASWYQTWQNLMLLFIGALFAAVVSLVGRAIAGYGWFAVGPAPTKSL